MTKILMRCYPNGERGITIPLPTENFEDYLQYSECFRPGCALFEVDVTADLKRGDLPRLLHPHQHVRSITVRQTGYLSETEAERVAAYARESGDLWSTVPRARFRDTP